MNISMLRRRKGGVLFISKRAAEVWVMGWEEGVGDGMGEDGRGVWVMGWEGMGEGCG